MPAHAAVKWSGAAIGTALLLFAAAAWAAKPPRPMDLAVGQQAPMELAVGETHVYWINAREDQVRRVPKRGGKQEVVVRGHPASALAVDGARLFVRAGQRLLSVPSGGGEVTVLAEVPGASSRVVLDAAHVYFNTGARGGVWRVPKQGGEPRRLLQFEGAGVGALAVDGTHLFAAVLRPLGEPGEVVRVPLEGGAPERIYRGARVAALALDGESLYLAVREEQGVVLRMPKAGGEPTRLATAPHPLHDLSVDGGFVFAAGGTVKPAAGRILRIPTSGGEATTLVKAPNVWRIQVDAEAVYWVTLQERGAVRRLLR